MSNPNMPAVNADLSQVPMSDLLAEVLRRPDEMFVNLEKGFLGDKAFALADILGIRVCVDGAPVRINENGEIEMMAIHRNTGPYADKFALVGGGVGRKLENGKVVPETFEEALTRHFDRDLGQKIEPIEGWDRPHHLAQDMRPDKNGEVRPGFYPNPDSRHLAAARFLVRITEGEDAPIFGSTEMGGQEAAGVLWFTKATMPDHDAFGYNHGVTYDALFPIADRLAQDGLI